MHWSKYQGAIDLSADLQESDPAIAMFRQLVQCALAVDCPSTAASPQIDVADWSRIYGLAEAHGLLSLLGTQADRLAQFAVPAALLDRIAQYAQANALRNRMLLQEYRELLALFQGAGIAVVPLKGIAAIQRITGYATFRELADIDILIDARRIGAAKSLLEARGYQAVYAPNTVPLGATDLRPEQAQLYASVYHEFSFASRDDLVYVDVHWRLSPSVYPASIPVAVPLFEPAEGGFLSVPFELVYLCMHAAKDGWSEFKWAVDIACLLRDLTAEQWQDTWALARRCRLRKALFAGIALAEWLTGQQVGLQYDQCDIAYRPSANSLARLRRRLLNFPERKHRLVSCLGLNKIWIALCDGNRDRISYIYRMFTYPQPRDFVRFGLRPAILPVWPLLRPFVISAYCFGRAVRVLLSGRTRPPG